jgi:hypothetical protein
MPPLIPSHGQYSTTKKAGQTLMETLWRVSGWLSNGIDAEPSAGAEGSVVVWACMPLSNGVVRLLNYCLS